MEQDNTTGNLDPQAVALAKSIRQTESGNNFGQKGKSGEYGAYQWLPSTWQKMSASAGVNVPLNQATPEQQNEVAYKQIEDWKTKGYNPAQIASMWNSGDPNAYLGSFSDGLPSKGKNSSGVSYSVPDYVDKVTSTYQRIKPQTSPNPSTPNINQGNDLGSVLGGLGAGALAWLGGHVAGVAKTGLPILGTAAGLALTEGNPIGGVVGGQLGQEVSNFIPGGNSGNNQPPTSGNEAPAPQGNEPNQNNINPLEAPAQSSSVLKDVLTQALSGTQSNRVFSETKPGQDAINTAAIFNLVSPDENGIMHFNEEQRQQALKELAQLDDEIIKADGGTAQPMSALAHAGQYIAGDRFSTPLDKKQAFDHAEKEMKARGLDLSKPSEMSLEDMRSAQKEHYAVAKGGYKSGKTSAEILAHKALGNGFGEAIRERLKNPDLHDRVLGMEKNLINVKELGKRLEGKKAPLRKGGLYEALLKQGARAAEIYIGDKIGGPLGAIIGGLIGEHFNRKLEHKYGRNIFETREVRAALKTFQNTHPKEYTDLISALKEYEAETVGKDKKQSPKEAKAEEKRVKGLIKLVKKGVKGNEVGKLGEILKGDDKDKKPKS